MSEYQMADLNPDTVSHVYFMDEDGVKHRSGHFRFIRDGGHFEIVLPADEDTDSVIDRVDTEGTAMILAINEYDTVGYGMLKDISLVEESQNVLVNSLRVSSSKQGDRMISQCGDSEVRQGEGRYMDFKADGPLTEVFIGAKDADGDEIHGQSIDDPEGRFILTRLEDNE